MSGSASASSATSGGNYSATFGSTTIYAGGGSSTGGSVTTNLIPYTTGSSGTLTISCYAGSAGNGTGRASISIVKITDSNGVEYKLQ